MIQLSIRGKLFIAIFLACAIAVVTSTAIFRWQFQRTYLNLVHEREQAYLEQLQQYLISYYAEVGHWNELLEHQEWRRLHHLVSRQLIEERNYDGAPRRRPPIHHLRHRTILLDANRLLIHGNKAEHPPDIERELQLDGQLIGYLGLHKRLGLAAGSRDAQFVQHQNKSLLLISFASLLASLGVAFLLSRQLIKPIRHLQHSTRELANGNYNTRIQSHNHDELGQLSHDFNQLAQQLQQHEQARQQWIMDIAHELRTPLAVLRGEIEAIQDGINTADTEAIQSLHQEALHLQRLVDDLYNLSLSDSGDLSYHKARIDVVQLLKETLAQFKAMFDEQGIALDDRQISMTPLIVKADNQRLQQLFQNLLKNSLRYTDRPGQCRVCAYQQNQMAIIVFEDSPPSVPTEALPLIFNRLYRVDTSRNRATGGAGIGLSISFNIVKAHDGKMSADHTALGGLKITIQLPMSN